MLMCGPIVVQSELQNVTAKNKTHDLLEKMVEAVAEAASKFEEGMSGASNLFQQAEQLEGVLGKGLQLCLVCTA